MYSILYLYDRPGIHGRLHDGWLAIPLHSCLFMEGHNNKKKEHRFEIVTLCS